LPDASPLWIDFDDSNFSGWSLFGVPGEITSVSGAQIGTQLRSAGAQTTFFDLYLSNRMGTPSAPADPATIPDRVTKLFAFAASVSGCSTPLIAENELFGAGTITPWSATNAQYRANVLAYLQGLAAKGARPFLLVSSAPFTGGDAGAWWLQVAQVADIVQEFFANPKTIAAKDPVTSSRSLRVSMRQAVQPYLALGIPPSRVGLMLEYEQQMRQGLQPATAWFQAIKLETLAAQEVSTELALGSVWSWGWATFAPTIEDPDKAHAACVYLWTRSNSLCDGISAAGTGFDPSLTEGQLALPAGVQCSFPDGTITTTQLNHLSVLTGDPTVALSALLGRIVESRQATISAAALAAVEASLIRTHFRGSRSLYVDALTKAQASESAARAVLADQLRRAKIQSQLEVAPPTGDAVRSFAQTYGNAPARAVRVTPAPWWLGGSSTGVALAPTAPAEIFYGGIGKTVTIPTADGVFKIKATGPATKLSGVPLSRAKPSIVAALTRFAQYDAYQSWLASQETTEVAAGTCLNDQLPKVAAIDLSAYLPYLALS
jgi:hypothetical protein